MAWYRVTSQILRMRGFLGGWVELHASEKKGLHMQTASTVLENSSMRVVAQKKSF